MGKKIKATNKFLALGVHELPLCVHYKSILSRNGNIKTVRDLIVKSENDLLQLKHLGPFALKEISSLLEEMDLSLSATIFEPKKRRSEIISSKIKNNSKAFYRYHPTYEDTFVIASPNGQRFIECWSERTAKRVCNLLNYKYEKERRDRVLKLMDLDIEHKRLENEKLKVETEAIKKHNEKVEG